MEQASQWDEYVLEALSVLSSKNRIRSSRTVSLAINSDQIHTFNGPQHWDRSTVEVHLDGPTFNRWLQELPNPGGETELECKEGKKMVLFSGNDYLGLSSHPSIRNAAIKVSWNLSKKNYFFYLLWVWIEFVGRSRTWHGAERVALVCGFTSYHKMLESSIAELKKKEDCLVCPTGFSANMAFMSALGEVSSLLAVG